MEFSTKAGTPDRIKSGCIVVGVYADRKLTPAASLIDAASEGALASAAKRGDLPVKRGGVLMLTGLSRDSRPSGCWSSDWARRTS